MYNRKKAKEFLKEYFTNPNYECFLDEGSSREVLDLGDYVLKLPLYQEIAAWKRGELYYVEPVLVDIDKYEDCKHKKVEEVRSFLKDKTPEDFLTRLNGVNQNILEYLTWVTSSEDVKRLLAPIRDFFFYEDLPIVIMQKAQVFEWYLDEFQYEDEHEEGGIEYMAAMDDYEDFRSSILDICPDLVSDLCESNCGLINGEIKMIDYGLNRNSNFDLI